jgi:thioredoxin reductase
MDVLIIGAGPAGLSVAATLARAGVATVVLDREAVAGGIPRHSAHLGFGLRDQHRFQSGPAYARRLAERAVSAGARIELNAMVTGWAGPLEVEVTSPTGRRTLAAAAIVLATGARERPRAARMIPGDRPSGVYTTGQLQQLVAGGAAAGAVGADGAVGRRAVVVGAEAVSWSAVLTLRHAGARTVLMTTELARPPALAAITAAGRAVLRVPVATGTRVARIIGRDRVSGVEIEDGRTGRRRTVDCDTVVFTADWIPDHELARAHGIDLDPGTLGPLVDAIGRTSRPGVFAVGNLIHPVDTADRAALGARAVAAPVQRWLAGQREATPALRLIPGPGLRWITPGLVTPGLAPGFAAWARLPMRRPRVVLEQDGRPVATRPLRRSVGPGRVLHLPADLVAGLLAGLDPAGGEVIVSLR